MSEPMQLSFPENAQINIYVTGLSPMPRGPVASEDEQPARPRRLLRPAVVGLVLFGLGYGVHGLTAPQASAEGDQATRVELPVMPAPPGPASLIPGPRQGAALAPSIHGTPPQPVGTLAGGPPPPASIGRLVPPNPVAPSPAARNPFGLN